MSEDSDFSKDSDVMDDEFPDEDENVAAEETTKKSDGFADMMSKILNQKVGDKIPVLAKRKTNLMKEAEGSADDKAKLKKQRLERRLEREKQIQAPDQTPAATDFERQLRKLATRGVVALFNAIAKVKREAAAAAAGDDGDDDNPDTSNAEVAKRSNGGDEGKRVKQLTHEGFLALLKGGAPMGRGTGTGTGTDDNADADDDDGDDDNGDVESGGGEVGASSKSAHKKNAASKKSSTAGAVGAAVSAVGDSRPGWSALRDDYDHITKAAAAVGTGKGKGKGTGVEKGKLALKNWDKDDSSDEDGDEEVA